MTKTVCLCCGDGIASGAEKASVTISVSREEENKAAAESKIKRREVHSRPFYLYIGKPP